MPVEEDEAGNEIIDKLFYYADWADDVADPPEDITIGTKVEAHPRVWIQEVTSFPAIFVYPLSWPANTAFAQQYEHLYTCEIYGVIEAETATKPVREARVFITHVKRNLVAAWAITEDILGLSYINDMVWQGVRPENEFSRFAREHNLPFACSSIGFQFTAHSDRDDYGA